jgi:hypothetical protein
MLAFFSIPNPKNNEEFAKNRYLMFLNSQLCEIANKSLIETIIDLSLKNNEIHFELKKLLVCYFDEIGDVEVEKEDSTIELLLQLMSIKLKSLQVDEIFRLMVRYWINKENSEINQKLVKVLPHIELLFMIANGEVDKFIKLYHEKMQEFEKFSKINENSVEDAFRRFNFDILCCAIKNNQRKVIDFIITIDSFENFNTTLPETINVEKIHHYTALKLIKQRNQINLDNFPNSWVTCGVLKDFLDSKVSDYNQQFIEIDLRFLGVAADRGGHGEIVSFSLI